MLTSLLAAGVDAAPAKGGVLTAENYQSVQGNVPDGGYVLALYADGWDKYSEKLTEKMLADASMTKQELLEVLNGFYPLEKQNEMGVVGIRVEIV